MTRRLAFLVLVMAPFASESRDVAWCEEQWALISAGYDQAVAPDYKALHDKWRTYEKDCRGNGAYEARLAPVLVKLNRPSEALENVRSVKAENAQIEQLVTTARLHAEYAVLVTNGKTDKASFAPLEVGYKKLLQKAPDWYMGYEMAANFMLVIEKPATAIEYGERAVALEPNSWAGYRALAIAHSDLGHYEKSAKAGDKAHQLRKAQSSDSEFMLALARSYSAMKDKETTELLLSLLIHHQPTVRDTPEYRSTLMFIRNQLNGAQQTVPADGPASRARR